MFIHWTLLKFTSNKWPNEIVMIPFCSFPLVWIIWQSCFISSRTCSCTSWPRCAKLNDEHSISSQGISLLIVFLLGLISWWWCTCLIDDFFKFIHSTSQMIFPLFWLFDKTRIVVHTSITCIHLAPIRWWKKCSSQSTRNREESKKW